MPPFNKEIEDFAQAFSSGYGMTKSKEEREAEQLNLEKSRLEVGHLPKQYEQQDAESAARLSGQTTANKISEFKLGRLPTEAGQADAEHAARLEGQQTANKLGEFNLERAPKVAEHEDILFGQDVEIKKGQLADAKVARERLPIEWKQHDELAATQIADAKLVLDRHKEDMSQTMVDARRQVAEAEALTAKANATIAQEGATPEALQQKREAIQAEIDAHKAAMAASNAAASAVPSEIKLRESTTRHQDAESEKLEMTNELFANAKKAAQRLQGGQPLDEPVEAVDPNLSGPRVRGKPVIPSLQAPTPSWGTAAPGPQSAVDVPPGSPSGSEAFISTHDDKSEGITKGAKNSSTAKTMRKLKNGEIPSFSDLIDVGVEASVNAAKSAADDAGIHNDEAVSTPGSELNFSNWLKGAHGADAATAQMAIDTVKEVSKGRLSPQQEALSTTGLGYLTFSLAGMPDEALNFAKGMQGYAQQLTGQYAAFAKAAAANGDVDATTMSLMKSYMNIPNGKDLDIRPDPKHEGMFIAKITDTRTGKIEEEHVVTPDEMVGKAMGVTSGTSMEILNAAAGSKDETISDAAARVLAAEYKQYGLTAEEISKMTTAEFEKVQERLEKDITARKPKEYTLEQSNTATTQVDAAFEKFKESNADQIKALKLDDPTVGTMEDLLPAASQILLYNSDTGMMPQRALRATLNLVANGPSEPVMNLPDGRLLVSVNGVDPFVMSANEYTILTANRRKYGVPTASGLPPDAQRYEVGGQSAVEGTLSGAATAPGKGEYNPYAIKPVGEYDPNAPDPIVEIFRKGVEGLNRPGAGAVPYDMSGGSRAGPAVPVPPSPTGRPYIPPNPADYPEELIRRGYPGR